MEKSITELANEQIIFDVNKNASEVVQEIYDAANKNVSEILYK